MMTKKTSAAATAAALTLLLSLLLLLLTQSCVCKYSTSLPHNTFLLQNLLLFISCM
jgi:hypothetical protein